MIEAMKMQNVVRAEQDGILKKIHVSAVAKLAVDAVILEFADTVALAAGERSLEQ